MIITKKEFKEAVKKIIVDGINNTQQENITEEKNAEADKKLATVLTDYYEKVIRNIFHEDCWTYNEAELTHVSALVLENRFSNSPEPLVFMENLACIATTTLLINMLEEKMQEEEPQEKELDVEKEEEPQEKEFDVEEILKEARSEQE